MNALLVVLRLLHILGGVFWVGGALAMNFFIGPTLRSTGDVGKQFGSQLMSRTRLSPYLTFSAITSVVAGLILYGIDSNWFTSAWQSSGPGIGFGVGALFGLIGLFSGIKNGSNIRALGRLGSQIQGKPTAEQAAQLAAIQKQQAWIVPVNTYSLLLSLAFMAIARYLRF